MENFVQPKKWRKKNVKKSNVNCSLNHNYANQRYLLHHMSWLTQFNAQVIEPQNLYFNKVATNWMKRHGPLNRFLDWIASGGRILRCVWLHDFNDVATGNKMIAKLLFICLNCLSFSISQFTLGLYGAGIELIVSNKSWFTTHRYTRDKQEVGSTSKNGETMFVFYLVDV